MKERWKADMEKVNGHIGITIENDEGMQIATVYLHTYVAPNREGGEINQPENAIARERAFLIAACPELLEACKDFLSFEYARGVIHQSRLEKCMCQECIEKRAKSIIQKVEGAS